MTDKFRLTLCRKLDMHRRKDLYSMVHISEKTTGEEMGSFVLYCKYCGTSMSNIRYFTIPPVYKQQSHFVWSGDDRSIEIRTLATKHFDKFDGKR